MSKFRKIVENAIKETMEFAENEIVAFKMNPNQIGKIVKSLGEKRGRLYYSVAYPVAIGAYIGDYKFGWVNKPIPADQLVKSSEEKLLNKIEEIKNKYQCK